MSYGEVPIDQDGLTPVRRFLPELGAETDVSVADVYTSREEGSTEPDIMERASRHRYETVAEPRKSYDVSSLIDDDVTLSVVMGTRSAFIPNMGDFVTLDYYRTPDAQVRLQIRNLRTSLKIPYSLRLAGRLDRLLELLEEEGDALTDASADSLRHMLKFLECVPQFRYPIVTIMSPGTFRLQWTGDSNAHFAAEFLPEGRVRYVIFAPDRHHVGQIRRTSGVEHRENLMGLIATYGVDRWAGDARTSNSSN